eukprot:3928509-Alexandrium_andersonii.AAC.1
MEDRETVLGLFDRGRVVDRTTVNRFMPDQVGAWLALPMDMRLIVEATLRATVSILATNPYLFATSGGQCHIDSAGWIPADSFYRSVARLCGPDALHTACVALTQIGKKDTGTWDG